jgi:Flp pilus assembly protein TadD
MVSVIVVIAVIGVGWMVWRRRGRWRTPAASGTPAGSTPESLAFEAFTHGNTCLAAGKFAEATAAFQRARELDPKRPHVSARLAEVARRQQTASPPPISAS